MQTCPTSDRTSFFRAWLRQPLKTASITPSGRSLARLMTSEIGPETGRVLELGVGTGVFTRALLDQGVAEHDLTLIEQNPAFLHMLKARHPQAELLNIDASRMTRHRSSEAAPFGATISGLPLLSMPTRTVMAILAGSFGAMTSNGKFYQFTYGPRCPVRRAVLERMGLKAVRIGRATCNLPPAAVYRISRRQPLAI